MLKIAVLVASPLVARDIRLGTSTLDYIVYDSIMVHSV